MDVKALGFDPEAVLVHDTAVLLDPTFLGSLHAEMEEEMGRNEAGITLIQIGFLHGICDAYRVVDGAFAGGPAAGYSPFVPSLPIQLETRASVLAEALEISGGWPERREAEARLVRSGTCEHSTCFVSAGYTSGWLSGTLNADLLALETRCCASGADACRFVAREPEDWRERGDARALAVLEALPFSALRQMARTVVDRRAPDPDAAPIDDDAYDPEAAVVHIWGPVMVIPFTSPDEAMHALELIRSDPSAREVSVLVVDLAGAVLDDAFGAATLERLVETAEAWGAETLLAGASPLCEGVIAELERPPLAVHKELPGAIAAAFQIARAQRAPV